ncbi:MAG: carboxypeptidase regulatory-like domain-containing protein, partial [Acidobacteriaceae bacterium]|nr:carboxypeptidase regulatory-like domain-containing protein [Acidobacteriaceae bacterium]
MGNIQLNYELRSFSRLDRAALIAALLLGIALTLPAQTTSGSITGTVVDPQGAAVPGATVIATDIDRNTTLTGKTDTAGNFVFPQALPSRYTITVKSQGFKKYEERGLVLLANSVLSVPPIKLEVGTLNQSVEVISRGEQVDTATAERGDTIVSQQLNNIQVKGRTYLGLLQLSPGVRTDRDFSTNTNELGNIYADGSRGNQQHLTVNGVTDTDYGANGRMLVTVSLEAVQEFKVLTANYQAQYGFGSGAEISVVTKSGTNNFHGMTYWYFRDKALNANTWRNNRDGVAKPYFHQNYLGYQIGGPIYIPNKFNTNKDKLFFFWSDEYQRQLFPADANGNSIFRTNMPTALERQGNFSQSVDKNGCPLTSAGPAKANCPRPPGILDPITRQPYPNGIIPAQNLYMPGIRLLNLLPLPNAPGNTGFNYVYQPSGTVPRHEQTLRLDFNPTDKWRIYGTWVNLPQDVVDINASPAGYQIMPNFPITPVSFRHPGFMSTLNATRIISPAMTNEASFAVNYHQNRIFPDNPSAISNSATGINLPTLFPQAAGYIPNFGFSGTRIGTSPTLKYVGVGSNGAYAPWSGPVTILEWVDNFSSVHNNHLVKAGIYVHRDRKDQTAFLESEGVYDFGDSASNPFDTNFGFANAAVGVYSSFTQATHLLTGHYRFSNVEFYGQDTWKITSRVTLDYGLRAYWIQPAYDQELQTSNFLPNLYNPSQTPLLYQPALTSSNVRVAVDPRNPSVTLPAAYIGTIIPNTGPLTNGIRQAGQGINKYLMDPGGIRLGPRLGVAIDLTGRHNLVFRAGGGVMYDRYQLNEIFSLIGNPPEALQTTVVNGLVNQLNPSAAIIGAPSLSGVAGGAIAYGGGIPTSYKYSAGIEAALPFSMVLDTSYVGTLGRHLLYNYPLNAIPYGADYLPQNQDPTKVRLSPTAILGSNAYDSVFLRPYHG